MDSMSIEDDLEQALQERDDYKEAADSLGKALDESQRQFEDLVEDMPRENRIEGLRAASRIVAASVSSRVPYAEGLTTETATIKIAKTFATYLEKGEW